MPLKDTPDKKPSSSPLSWLFNTALTVLIIALILQWAIGILAQIWIGVLVVFVLAAAVVGAVRWWQIRCGRW